ncbi:hypothetical protein Hanom_Chr07g00625501 [Helianthus anomalus]
MKVYAIKRECDVQYFKYLKDIKTLPWWDVEELVQTKIIQTDMLNGVRFHEARLWGVIKYQAMNSFRDWKPHYPKKIVQIDLDFYTKFKGWYYDPKTGEAVISLKNEETWMWRGIRELDPMWLVNCSKKDNECLLFTKIWYLPEDKEQAMQFHKIINVCFEKDINSGHYWKSN